MFLQSAEQSYPVKPRVGLTSTSKPALCESELPRCHCEIAPPVHHYESKVPWK